MALPYFPTYVKVGDSISDLAGGQPDTGHIAGQSLSEGRRQDKACQPATLLPSARLLFRQDFRAPRVRTLHVPLLTLTAGFESPSLSDAETHLHPCSFHDGTGYRSSDKNITRKWCGDAFEKGQVLRGERK